MIGRKEEEGGKNFQIRFGLIIKKKKKREEEQQRRRIHETI